MKLLWLFFIVCVGVPIVYLSVAGMRFETFSFTALHENRSFAVSFELPIFSHWKPAVRENELERIVIDYVLQEGKFGYDENDVAATVTIRKAERTIPLSVSEQSQMLKTRGGDLIYSEPKENESQNIATTLVQTADLPGFYVIESTVNMTAPCNLSDSRSIVQSVLSSIAPGKNYRNKGNVELSAGFLWFGTIQWPNQIQSCF